MCQLAEYKWNRTRLEQNTSRFPPSTPPRVQPLPFLFSSRCSAVTLPPLFQASSHYPPSTPCVQALPSLFSSRCPAVTIPPLLQACSRYPPSSPSLVQPLPSLHLSSRYPPCSLHYTTQTPHLMSPLNAATVYLSQPSNRNKRSYKSPVAGNVHRS